MIILRSEQELEKFIQEESEMCGKHNSWLEGEIRDSIKPKEYPCAVFTHWGEGASGCYLVSSVVYQSDFEPVMEMCLCEPEHLFKTGQVVSVCGIS